MLKNNPERYWIILGERVQKVPRRYKSFEEAEDKVTRLIKLNPGRVYTILHSVNTWRFVNNCILKLWHKKPKKELEYESNSKA